MSLSRSFLNACVVAIAAAGSLAAQDIVAGDQPAAVPAVAPATAAPTGPVAAPAANDAASLIPFAANASVGVHVQPANAPAPYAPPRRDDHVGTNVMLMIVGGAALVTGAVVSGSGSSNSARNVGDIFMISGAVVGIIGLIRYLQ